MPYLRNIEWGTEPRKARAEWVFSFQFSAMGWPGLVQRWPLSTGHHRPGGAQFGTWGGTGRG